MLWCAIEYYCFYLLLYKKKGIKMHFSIFLFNIEGEKKCHKIIKMILS